MKSFFSVTPGFYEFKLFGYTHFLLVLSLVIVCYLIYKYKEKIRKFKYYDKQMRYLISIFMFMNMSIYYFAKVINGTYDFKVHLPFHFCFISGYLFMYCLITNNKKMFRYLYFFSMMGPIPAILLPDLKLGIDRYIFYQYFISHHFFIMASIYTLYVLEWEVEKKDIFSAIYKSNIIFVTAFIFNHIFNTNYIMTSKLPTHVLELIPFLTYFNYSIIWIELCGLLVIALAYVPVHYLNKNKSELGNQEMEKIT